MSADELRIEWMRLGEIREAKRNSKLHDLDELDASARALGWTTEQKLDERTGRLIRGHGRLRYLRRERDRGAAPPEGIRVADDGEWLTPVVRGWASRDEHHATAAKIADNDVGKKSGHDQAVLLDELAELAADAPDLLAATTHTSSDLDRLVDEASRTELPTVLLPDDTDRGSRGDRPGVEDRGGDLDDVGSTREDGPGPLDVEPAWRTLHPLRGRYHDGTPDGADRIVRWLRERGATDVHAEPNLTVTWEDKDGAWLVIPGQWVTYFRGRHEVMSREELDEEFVAANEPARRANRDAKPITRGAAVLRHGSGVL